MEKNRKNIIIITIIFAILSIILYKESGNIFIDFSRETYIPYQMLQGEKLNSDIFLIYGPFGYFLNMFLYKIAVNVNLLYIEALFIAYSTTILFYFIVKKYTNYTLALLYTVFFIITSIYSNSNFSFATPYSYSTLWAVFGTYLILFSHLYKFDKIKYITLGFVAINKIEFFIVLLIFTVTYDFIKKNINYKNYLHILIFPILCLLYIGIGGIADNFQYILKMSNTTAIKNLYNSMGSYFEINYFLFNIKFLAIYLILASISYFLFKINKPISLIVLVITYYLVQPNMYLHLSAFIAIILSIINRQKLKKADWVLLCFSLLLCSKSIFAINSMLYSNFGYALMIFYIFRQLCFVLNKKWVISNFIILAISLFIGQFFDYKNNPKLALKTSVGTFKMFENDYEISKDIDNYLKENLGKNDDLIVVPEGQIFNLIHKKPWKFYNSTFTPLDFETFTEENIINKLKENKTDYIVFYPRTTKEYGAKIICYDYAVDFCSYVMDNYKRVAMFGDERKALIFKINEK